ncbi:hypothetical protein [uncultured Tolumonas sp.]|uniref:hypothetical protein n=1 Tax=uncultured Tolumonas sp. TaxID=263765 RepID=UPI002A0A3944|nr:hypothetical protein [uncultured Tolumonas sp.]
MTILEGDIKLLASERLADTEDGGGRMTGTEVVTGQHNSLFADISDLNRTTGRVDMRKVFLDIDTDNVDVYFGSHVAVLKPPADPNVAITLFTTKDHFDERADARDFVERYLAKGPRWQGYLYDTQVQGQRAIRWIQRATIRLPSVGDTFVLTGAEGSVSEFEQYVRFKDIKSELNTFSISSGNGVLEFTRLVVTAEITAPLRFTFEGNNPTPYDNESQRTAFRETVVADAANYYGTVPAKLAANFGSMQIYAETIFTQLVPSSREGTPAIDLTAGGQVSTLTPSDNGLVTTNTTLLIGPSKSWYLGTAAQPSSINISIGSAVIKDSGGELLLGNTVVGSVEYQRGIMLFNTQCPDYGVVSKVISFKPAASVTRICDTMLIPITESSRGYSYTATLKPIPDPSTLTVSFMAQGKWYDLTDNGKGVLTGADSTYGSGSISFTTGSLILTLGALPDTGSSILFAWGSPTTSFNRANTPTTRAGVSGVLGSTITFNEYAVISG